MTTAVPGGPLQSQRVPAGTHSVSVHGLAQGGLRRRGDELAVEEPLEIRLDDGSGARTLGITMRTPGYDFELVAGLLLAEAVVSRREEIRRIAYCVDRSLDEAQRFNVVTARLAGAAGRTGLERQLVTSSACGVCGTSSIESVMAAGHPALGPGPMLSAELLCALPELLGAHQRGFARTGALHGAALVDETGRLLVAREDVGRHNAVDKVVGWALLRGAIPLADVALVVSGRVSFEIVQKALRAGIALVAAVSAATSLAVRLAREREMTLAGFVRDGGATLYAGPERITGLEREEER